MQYTVTKKDEIIYRFLKYYAAKECEQSHTCEQCFKMTGDCLKDLASDFGKTIGIPDEILDKKP